MTFAVSSCKYGSTLDVAVLILLHTKLVQASQALSAAVKMLVDMPSDFVGGLVGAKKIEELGPVFADVAKQVAELEAEYGLE